MSTINRFFKKYLWTSVFILVLFCVINIVFGIGFLSAMRAHTIDSDKEIAKIAEGIGSNDSGQIFVEEASLRLLADKNSWAMILDDAGAVIWNYHLPDHLPLKYSVSDVAGFSRWYLEDYPVLVQQLDCGLLVVGYQPDDIFGVSMVKLYYVTDSGFIRVAVIGGVLLILVNIVFVIFLFWRNTRKVEKAVAPILHGIGELSHGNPVNLPENGELANINMELNHASSYIVKKDRARAEWINGISHDVRTPLSMIMGYAGEIEDDACVPYRNRQQAGIIRRQADKIKNLVTDLNLVSKLEYSMQPLRKEKVDLPELGRQVITDFLNNGLESKYELDYDIRLSSDMNATIEGDTALLQRMLTNLLQNSISHNPEGCHIRISLQRVEDEWMYEISDDGVGVSDEKIAELNSKVSDSAADYMENGEAAHGYGRKLVRYIVEAHKGRILYKNNVPQGLCVEIYL